MGYEELVVLIYFIGMAICFISLITIAYYQIFSGTGFFSDMAFKDNDHFGEYLIVINNWFFDDMYYQIIPRESKYAYNIYFPYKTFEDLQKYYPEIGA